MTLPELVLRYLEVLIWPLLVLFIAVQLMSRLDRLLEKRGSGPIKTEEDQVTPVADDYQHSAISRELLRQRDTLLKEQSPEAKGKAQIIERVLNTRWQPLADGVGTCLLQIEEAGAPVERILKQALEIQYPGLDPMKMPYESLRAHQLLVERVLAAFSELGLVSIVDGKYQMTLDGRQIFEKAHEQRVVFEEKFYALYPGPEAGTHGCHDGNCVFFVQSSSDDASESPGGTEGLFGVDDENIYLGECERGEPITAGFRVVNVDIPAGAVIRQARLEFVSDGPYMNAISVSVHAEARGNVNTFSDTDRPSGRPMAGVSVPWRIPARELWVLGQIHASPDISTIAQAIVGRPDWKQGNALAILVRGAPGGSPGTHRRLVGFVRASMDPHLDPPRLVVRYLEPPKEAASSSVSAEDLHIGTVRR